MSSCGNRQNLYSQLFFDYAILNNIPITFGFGVPIINSNPAKLLVLYHNWMTSGFLEVMLFNKMITSDTFNRAMWKKSCQKHQKILDGRSSIRFGKLKT